MHLLETIADLRTHLAAERSHGRRVGFVPTMGYLHDGHIALVERARQVADIVVASIYVNPTQFAVGEDLATYPRDLDGDRKKLEDAGCSVLYLPQPDEIYPDGFSTYVTVDGVTSRYEGASRPEHFRGVTTIVAKLFNIVTPDAAVFGQKDAQQVAVVRRMIRDLNFGIELHVVETIRESDGLAMSSRNVYLSESERREATSISRALAVAKQAIASGMNVQSATDLMRRTLSESIHLDYADIIDATTFEPAADATPSKLGIIAGRVGRTRLIDNMVVGGG